MCGRYKGPDTWAELNRVLGGFTLTSAPQRMDDEDEVRPTNIMPIVTRCADGGYDIREARWGLIPHFYTGKIKDWKAVTINAKIEEVADKNSFRAAWKYRHCLVPAAYFWEWAGPHPTDPKKKMRHRIERADNHQMVMAGLWDTAKTADGDVTSFTIMTRGAGPDMLSLHHREPVFLHDDQWLPWLDNADMPELIEPAISGTLRHRPELAFG